jgi:hypothetical protein
VIDHGFSDVPADLASAVNWAVTTGVLTPAADGGFGAETTVTRAAVAKALYALGQVMASVAASVAGPTTTTVPVTTTTPGGGDTTTSVPLDPTSLPPTTVGPPPTTTPPTISTTIPADGS